MTRIRHSYFETNDGGRIFGKFKDTVFASACSVRRASDGIMRCLPPTETAQDFFYPDATCAAGNIVAVGLTKATCPVTTPRFVFGSTNSICPTGTSVLKTGPIVSAPLFVKNASNACQAVAPSSTLDILAFGLTAMKAEEFEEAYMGMVKGVGRLRTSVSMTSSGALPLTAFEDLKLGTGCSAQTASDGVSRCLPTGYGVDLMDFADADCRDGSVTVLPIVACDERWVTRFDLKTCTDRRRLFPVQANVEAFFRKRPDGTCVAVTARPPFRAVRLGPEVPPTEFEELKAVGT